MGRVLRTGRERPALTKSEGEPRRRLALPVASVCRTLSYMRMTITVRTDEVLRDALEQRAAAEGRSLSEVARDVLRNALTERPLQTRVGHLRGRLDLRRVARQEWQESLRGHNRRP